jgi:hypothetical protein
MNKKLATTIGGFVTMIIISVGITTTTTTTTYAQPAVGGTPDSITSFGDASPQAERLAIEIAVSQIWNLTGASPSITISEDGTLSITQFANDQFITVNVHHNMTPERGFEINNGILTAPNGTQIFP